MLRRAVHPAPLAPAGDSPALWIDSKSTPAWVRGELTKVDSSAEQPGYSSVPPF